jgi:hypothetical protein
MIEQVLERWHRFLAGDLPGGLDELLHEDVVFVSPIVFTPQAGKELTTLYLQAAFTMLVEREPEVPEDRRFRYVKQVWGGHHAVLEFETFVYDTYVNGVDIITCDDDGRIVEFKVMIRPLKAVNLLHEKMRLMLERLPEANQSGPESPS